MKKFYFIVPVWGQNYVDMLTNVLLRCCLSPNNIPALTNLAQSKFIFVSDFQSYEQIKKSSIFSLLQKYIQPIFLPLDFSEKTNKFVYMTKAYKQATEVGKIENAVCIYLTADHIISDGAFLHLQKLLKQGKSIYHLISPRINKEQLLDYLHVEGLDEWNKPLELQPRKLANIALDFLHEEYRRYNIGHKYFAPNPHILSITPTGEKGMVFKAFQQHPVMVDLQYLQQEIFFNVDVALDIDFINDNLICTNSLYYETDSDNLVMCSLTSASDCIPTSDILIDEHVRLATIHKSLNFMLRSGHVNRIHEHAFINTYKLHVNDLNSNWQDADAELFVFNKIVRSWQNKNYGFDEAFKVFVGSCKQIFIKNIKKYPRFTSFCKIIYNLLKVLTTTTMIFFKNLKINLFQKVKNG